MQKEHPIQQLHLRFNTDLQELARLLSQLELLLCPYLPEEIFWQCQTAIAEGFTNAVRHAHHNLPPTTPIDLEVKVLRHSVEIQLWDCGAPFDLAGKLAQIRQNPEDWTQDHGRGLCWMAEFMDELRYIRVLGQKNEPYPERNCLIMRRQWRGRG
ncbi:ATP-binding protein [Spirulina subsalsa]|uniref:ATP-binding protein n=1 Tax=Spirulina subsalsa TaxID=54311 RepID=UPI0003175DBA|nr:ATP-binding protein [Spirulina subsalsa]